MAKIVPVIVYFDVSTLTRRMEIFRATDRALAPHDCCLIRISINFRGALFHRLSAIVWSQCMQQVMKRWNLVCTKSNRSSSAPLCSQLHDNHQYQFVICSSRPVGRAWALSDRVLCFCKRR